MGDITFGWDGPGRLVDVLKGPFTKISTPADYGKPIFALKLWSQDGRVLVIYSEMHDLYDREEVGVLKFSEALSAPSGERELSFDGGMVVVASISKCTAAEAGYGVIDCGVVLHVTGRDDIVITAGNFPCSIAVKGIPGLTEEFDPEYPVDRYRCEPMLT